jgi:hypothetical protein
MLRLPLVLIADAIHPQKARVKVVSDTTVKKARRLST